MKLKKKVLLAIFALIIVYWKVDENKLNDYKQKASKFIND